MNRYDEYKDIDTFVETGLGEGVTVKDVAPLFKNVHTIELSKSLFERISKRLEGLGITFHLGDSPKVLADMQDELAYPCVFYLDAHWCKGFRDDAATENPFPLWEELEVLKKRPYADIIIVDDIHAFGRKDGSGWETCSEERIKEVLNDGRTKETMNVRDFMVFYRKRHES